jgi:hypothetical protein
MLENQRQDGSSKRVIDRWRVSRGYYGISSVVSGFVLEGPFT